MAVGRRVGGLDRGSAGSTDGPLWVLATTNVPSSARSWLEASLARIRLKFWAILPGRCDFKDGAASAATRQSSSHRQKTGMSTGVSLGLGVFGLVGLGFAAFTPSALSLVGDAAAPVAAGLAYA